jgi:L-lactate dehydrogenase complex protein LldG
LFLLVPRDQLVASLDEALARIEGLVLDGHPYVTLMTGPSRTADIERALTVGVHGPRELHVVLVG